jgi:hypothetical protein
VRISVNDWTNGLDPERHDERADAPVGDDRDAALIRLIDHDPGDASLDPADGALDAVDGARLEQLRQRSTALRALLAADVPADVDVAHSAALMRAELQRAARARLTRMATRIAAAFALVLLPFVFVPPARAWVVDQVRAAAAVLGIARAADRPAGDVAPAAPGSATAAFDVSFAAASNVLTVHVATAGGTLVVRRGHGSDAVASASGARAGGLAIMPDGVRLDGGGSDDAVYTLTVPPHVRQIRVDRGGDVSFHDVPSPDRELRLPLEQ